jgi:hypothetical protein
LGVLTHGDGLEGWVAEDSPWTPTAWSRERETIIGELDGSQRARLVQGNNSWISYEVKVQATLVSGSAIQVHFSILENREDSYHFAALLGWQAAAIVTQDHTKLDVQNYILERGREYDIVVAVRGNSITSYIDGIHVNSVTVSTPPKGGVGLAIWGRGTIRFRDPKIRHYFKNKDSLTAL